MSELEKAEREYAENLNKYLLDSAQHCSVCDVKFAFIYGAEWQAKQSPWISVKERLPNSGKLVNVRCRNKNKEDGIWLCDVCFIDEDTNTWGERYHTWETITHWMPIPE
ncbi:DUF551 domain-containing protein [Bacteroides sp.]|uniref:DUF551 domain-containing protein n=1 Tax=Bacteroides sp. TaxID=29523 RepID=UPI0026391D9C|nr:DUF551 domain-containing protein [Bacteroides sp.]MDD3038844.1 DUF551 domain-containing protein [Bacteroides sp.]